MSKNNGIKGQQTIDIPDSKKKEESVTCLGIDFPNDQERRAYFTERLREKLPELKEIEGFPLGEDEDILTLSDPPYYTACPNPWINDFIVQWEAEKSKEQQEEPYHRKPFAADVSEGKNDPIYNAHSYHTKVPHKAIMRYILHYTQPGDIVFDGFCGTGMTGVAAQMCGDKETVISMGYQVKEDGTILQKEMDEHEKEVWVPFSKLGARKAVLNDLSPAATFIAYNYNTPVDVEEFGREANSILDEVEKECGWMYETKHTDGSVGNINYTVWSDVFVCPECSGEIVFWEVAVDKNRGKILNEFSCSNCGANLTKRNIQRVLGMKYDSQIGKTIKQAKQVPVMINYSVGRNRYEKAPCEYDYQKLNEIEKIGFKTWIPKNQLPNGYNTKQPIKSHGINCVHHFYTKRNLHVLALLWSKAEQRNEKTHNHLKVLISSYNLTHSTLMSRIIYKSGGKKPVLTGYQSGTLYTSSLPVEKNIIESIRNMKVNIMSIALSKAKVSLPVETKSSTATEITDSSFDYIFIDPPFGANIMYSELNYLWESWLKVWTNNNQEAIENKVQNKGPNEYRQLMLQCFKEAYRVLKPGRWMTVEFSNTKTSVWNSIQTAIAEAGFIVAHVAALDKQQGSFKAVTTPTAVKQDLVISAYKPSDEMIQTIKDNPTGETSLWDFIRNHLEQLPVVSEKGDGMILERTPRILFDRLVAYYVSQRLDIPISTSGEFQASVQQRFPMRDGMAFLETQVARYERSRMKKKEFVQLSLVVSDENSAFDWLRQQLSLKPQTRQDLYTGYMKEIQHVSKNEKLPELDTLLEENFLNYDGTGPVPSQIHTYLSTNFKDMQERQKEDPALQKKAHDRWYVPDPNKQSDLDQLRENHLLKEFKLYVEEVKTSRKKLKEFRLEAIRCGFKKAYQEKDYATIVAVGERLPDAAIQEDDKLLLYFDNALTNIG